MTGWLSASDGEKERAEQKNNIYKSCVQFSRVYFWRHQMIFFTDYVRSTIKRLLISRLFNHLS